MTSFQALHRTRGHAGSRASSRLSQCRRLYSPVWCSAKPDVAEQATSALAPATSTDDSKPASNRPRATFKASKLGRQPIVEAQRPLAEYMSLPASQYSVLDARRIERVDDDTFRCYVGELRFFSWSVEPVITVSVTVEPEGGCTIRLLGCKLQGSPFVEEINDKFTATMTNVVRHRSIQEADEGGDDVAAAAHAASESGGSGEAEGGGGQGTRPSAGISSSSSSEGEAASEPAGPASTREIVSDTTIEVCVEVPRWCGFLPVSSLEGAGSGVLQGLLAAMVPRFLAQLRQDYERWAAGDESRRPVGEM